MEGMKVFKDYLRPLSEEDFVFDSFLRTYLQAHLDNIDDTYAFSGGELMTRFYNEVIQNHGEPTGREFRDIIV